LISKRRIHSTSHRYSLSVQENLSLVVYVQLCDAFQQRRLSAAGFAFENLNIIFMDVQVDILTEKGERELCLSGFAEVTGLQGFRVISH
jgi:hypothetical protein